MVYIDEENDQATLALKPQSQEMVNFSEELNDKKAKNQAKRAWVADKKQARVDRIKSRQQKEEGGDRMRNRKMLRARSER